MEKIKERTSKYEISIRPKGKKYFEARISLNFGQNCKTRLQSGGKTKELVVLNLLTQYMNFLDNSFKNDLIQTKIDDIVTQRLIKSLNDIGLIMPEITQKALEIANKINYINSCILNTINISSNIMPIHNQFNAFPTLLPYTDSSAQSNNLSIKEQTIQNTQIEKCIIADLVNERLKYRLSLCKETPNNRKPLSQTTVDRNFVRLRDDILPYLRKHNILYLSQITETVADSLIKSINCQNSKHKSYVVLNMIFQYAIKHNKATKNIMEKVEKPPEKIKTGKDDVDDNYIEPDNQDIWLDLFEKENTDMSLLFETMLLTGLRPEEACGLKWKAFDLDENKLVINNAYKSFNVYNEDMTKVIGHYSQDASLKTPASYRDVPILNNRLRESLLKHKKNQEELFQKSRAIKNNHRKWTEDEYIFLGRNYHPYIPDSLAYGLTKFRKKYGLTKKEDYVTPYGLRRSFASYWSWKGMKKITLMHLMGHSNYETTVQHYIKISTKQIREEMKQLEEAS